MLLFTLSRRYTVPRAIYILRFNAELEVDTVPSSRACGKSPFEELSTATVTGAGPLEPTLTVSCDRTMGC